MTWNWRQFKDVTEAGSIYYFVGEAYYNNDGTLIAWSSQDHNPLIGDEPSELKETYDLLNEAFKAPVIDLIEWKAQHPKWAEELESEGSN